MLMTSTLTLTERSPFFNISQVFAKKINSLPNFTNVSSTVVDKPLGDIQCDWIPITHSDYFTGPQASTLQADK